MKDEEVSVLKLNKETGESVKVNTEQAGNKCISICFLPTCYSRTSFFC